MSETNQNNYTPDDKEFFAGVKAVIDRSVDEKIMSLSKTKQPIDKAAITEQCTKDFFTGVAHEWEKMAVQLAPFFPQLQHDNPEIFNKLRSALPPSEEAYIQSIKNCKSLRDFTALSPGTHLPTEDLKTLYEIGRKRFQENAYNKAIPYFLFLISCDPKNPDYWLAKGMAEQNLGKYDEALLSYYTVLQIDPTYALCYLQVMDTLIFKGQIDAAKQCYSAFIENSRPEEYSDDPFFVAKLKKIETLIKASKR